MEPVTVGNFLVEKKLAAITGSTIWVFGSFPANLSLRAVFGIIEPKL